MSDDSYFGEEMELDAATLAALDGAEAQFSQQTHPRPPLTPPYAKRQKLDSGHRKPMPPRRVESLQDDELPEIIVKANGGNNYLPVSQPRNVAQLPRQHVNVPASTAHATPSKTEDMLRRQIESLKKLASKASEDRKRAEIEREKAQKELTTAKFRADGENSMLRAKLAKADELRSASLMQLNNEKTAAREGRDQEVKALKQELEKLRTQHTFKTHELETSVRKPPRASGRFVIPPVPLTPQMRKPLPGFQNAFAPAQPKSKGKEHEIVPDENPFNEDNDSPMQDVEPVAVSAIQSLEVDMEDVEPPNWKEVVAGVILTHCIADSDTLAFQTLLSANVEPQDYANACSRIMQIIASASKETELQSTLDGTVQSFTIMLHRLNAAGLTHALVAILSILTALVLSAPTFVIVLLSQGEGDAPPPILHESYNVIRDQLSPPLKKGHESLARETILFLEAVSWTTPVDFEQNLASIPRCRGVLSVLFHRDQPTWFLSESAQLLAFVSTHQSVFRALLAFPEDVPVEKHNFKTIPHVDQMSALLVDSVRRGTEAHMMRSRILSFFASLSVAHTDALALIVQSETFIPSLVTYIANLAAPFWEQETAPAEEFRIMLQAISLLHHLVFASDPPHNLRDGLRLAMYKRFNGLMHLYIVTMGRVSYGDSPHWLTDKQQAELTGVAAMALKLLDWVVDGPEADSVYDAFHENTENSLTEDEEDLDDDMDMGDNMYNE